MEECTEYRDYRRGIHLRFFGFVCEQNINKIIIPLGYSLFLNNSLFLLPRSDRYVHIYMALLNDLPFTVTVPYSRKSWVLYSIYQATSLPSWINALELPFPLQHFLWCTNQIRFSHKSNYVAGQYSVLLDYLKERACLEDKGIDGSYEINRIELDCKNMGLD
jgi:hypothetical protein